MRGGGLRACATNACTSVPRNAYYPLGGDHLWPDANSLRASYTAHVFEIIKLESCPLTLMRPAGAPSDEELVETLLRITQFLEEEAREQRRGVIIMDMSRADALRASQRRIASDWMRDNNHRYKHVAIGTALIIASSIVRGVLTALLWVTPIDMPHDIFSNLDDAVRWAIKRFDEERIPIPDQVRRELGDVFDAQPRAGAARS